MSEIVGRDTELAAGEAFLDAALGHGGVLVLEGDAGIGKSTVWAAIVERARGRDLHVLVARPTEAEAQLTLTALADLLEPVDPAVIEALPEPQHRAVDAALLRSAPTGLTLEGRVLGTALRSVLLELARERPVLIAIDDVQWMDPASSAMLGFALRRLGDAPVALVLAHRRSIPLAATLFDGVDADRITRRSVGPMSVAAIHHVLKAQLEQPPSRSLVVRIHQASGGNPLFALEILRALAETGEPPAGEPLPVPSDVRELLLQRVHQLPDAARETLLAVASVSDPDLRLLEAVIGRDPEADLRLAATEGVARVDDGRVTFAHPLLGAAIYAAATPAERRSTHRVLATVLAGTEEGARHGALAAEGPDAAAADALEAAATATAARGAQTGAATLVELALRLTPPDDVAATDRRTVLLADLIARAGDSARGTALLRAAIASASTADARGRARITLAPIVFDSEGTNASVALCEATFADPPDDPELLAGTHAMMAAVSWDDFRRREEHVQEALRILDGLPDPDPQVLGLALMVRCGLDAEVAGGDLDDALIQRALELEARAPRPSVGERFSASLGVWLKYRDDFVGARHWIERTLQSAIDEGDEASIPFALSHLPQLELWTGHWPEAEARAARHLEVSLEQGLELQRRTALINLALVHVHQGRADEARAEASTVIAAAEADGDDWSIATMATSLGLLELSVGNPQAAAAHFERANEIRTAIGDAIPRRNEADLVESLVASGELDRADAALARFDPRARQHRLASQVANLSRARGMLQAARGDLAAAEASIDEALAGHAVAADIPFDRARTLVALGQVRRRKRERRAAAEAFEAALAIFEQLGAAIWAARTRDELDRLGLRRSGRDELTEGERRVAELAAAGMTNRQVADALFLSPKTVEAHLARAYAKLGITSRAELGAVVARAADGRPTS